MEDSSGPRLSTTASLGDVRIVRTSRLVLRAAALDDAADLFECFRDEEVMRYWDTLPHTSPDQTKLWVEKMMAGPRNGVTDFVICLNPDNAPSPRERAQTVSSATVIGKVGVWHGNEVGFLLNRRYWGRGFALEALVEVLDIAFHLDGTRPRVPDSAVPADVVADVDPRNHASLGVLKKLGFNVYATKEKTFQVGNEWVDSVYLSLTRPTWASNREELRRCVDRKSRPAGG